MPFILPLVAGAAALGAGGVGGARLLKDELNFTAQDAADQELLQGDRKGYNPETGKVNRGLIERLGDYLMGNSKEEIEAAAQKSHVKGLKGSTAGSALIDARPGFEFKPTTTQSDVNRAYRQTQKIDPIIQQIRATGELGDQFTTQELQKMDESSLLSILKKARRKESITDYETNPATIKADKRYVDSQNLQTALLANQMQQQNNQFALQQDQLSLDRRRMDMQERRVERRDRQAYIQQMMQGLSTLGASLAI